MPWTHTLCDSSPDCPGKVLLTLKDEHSELVVVPHADEQVRTFYCSLSALLGAQRGTRAHLVSQDGECVLSKEADGVWISILTPEGSTLQFFIPSDIYLIALAKLVEAKVIQKRVTLQ
jgi:hypothetical protein